MFSTLWKINFHSVELLPPICRFARYGSLARPAAPVAIELAFAHRPAGSGSALAYFPQCGKTFAKLFHCVEKSRKLFPLRGKNPPPKPEVFHTVENIFPHYGKLAHAG
ncbi:MAG: hypothetical protein WBK37_09740 [Kiritimatiellia bacterium]